MTGCLDTFGGAENDLFSRPKVGLFPPKIEPFLWPELGFFSPEFGFFSPGPEMDLVKMLKEDNWPETKTGWPMRWQLNPRSNFVFENVKNILASCPIRFKIQWKPLNVITILKYFFGVPQLAIFIFLFSLM
jgi:hypothetical protein